VADYQTPEFHPAFEEYCEAVWELKEDDVEVIQARIAERLDVSRPAVSEMIRRMQAEGFVTLDGSTINLTPKGIQLAEQVVRRHRLAERLLTDILGLPWADAHLEAGKWEHVISEPVERAINRVLDNPTTCPHGNPIPGSSYAPPSTVALADVPVGTRFVVSRIPEELEFTAGLLQFLEDASVRPGQSGIVTATSPDGTTTVEIDGQRVGIGGFASSRILVATSASSDATSLAASA
jgi:DtxR family transcriptional regulator, Mn-dependent transcriptional regulator